EHRAHEALFPTGSAMPQLPLITYTVGVKAVFDMLTQQEQQRYSNAIREAIKTAYPAYDVVVTLDNTIGGADCEVSNDPYGETDIAEHAHSIAHGVWIGAAWLDK
ncbi:hypothetical protein ACBB18_004486, partial [Salmonella enterica]